MKRKRTVVHVTYNAETKYWEATIAGFPVFADSTRGHVVAVIAGRLNYMLMHGYRGQVVVHNKSGRIAFEHTYLNDPNKTRG